MMKKLVVSLRLWRARREQRKEDRVAVEHLTFSPGNREWVVEKWLARVALVGASSMVLFFGLALWRLVKNDAGDLYFRILGVMTLLIFLAAAFGVLLSPGVWRKAKGPPNH